jgi:hypothetical protein
MNKNASLQIPRRAFLRGLGTLVALPALDSLFPARMFGAAATPRRISQNASRGFIPNGANMEDWTPATTGADYEMPMILQPLAEHRADLTVLTGLAEPDGRRARRRRRRPRAGGGFVSHRRASAQDRRLGHQGGHFRGSDCGQPDWRPDQIAFPRIELRRRAARRFLRFGLQLRLSVQHVMEDRDAADEPGGESALGVRASFRQRRSRRHAGGGRPRSLYRKSVLDYVLDDAHRMEGNLDAADRRKLDEYLTAVRDLETRIERAAQFPAPKVPDGTTEPENFESFEQQMQLMYDVLALAFQTDSTRIATFVISHDGSNRPYPMIGIREGHHDLSHHRNDEEKKHKLAQINRYHVTQFARFPRQVEIHDRKATAPCSTTA